MPRMACSMPVKLPATGMNSDLHGSAAYRAAMVSVLAARAVEMALAPADDVDDTLKRYYGLAAETLGRMARAAIPEEAQTHGRQQEKVEDIEKLAEDASIVQLVNQLILEAFRKRATDIHIEPKGERL